MEKSLILALPLLFACSSSASLRSERIGEGGDGPIDTPTAGSGGTEASAGMGGAASGASGSGSAQAGAGGDSAGSAGDVGLGGEGGTPETGGTGGTEPVGGGGSDEGGSSGAGGSVTVDPFDPVPAENCPGYYDWFVPEGTCIWVHGRFTNQNATCNVSNPATLTCATVSRPSGDGSSRVSSTVDVVSPSDVRVDRFDLVNGLCPKQCQ